MWSPSDPGQPLEKSLADQGAQFTRHAFINALKAYPIRISRDGCGRAADNIFVGRLWRTVKCGDIYLKDYQTLAQVQGGLKTYFTFYNGKRPHQSLGRQPTDQVYTTSQGSGAKIIDKFGGLSDPVSARPLKDETAYPGNAQQIFCCA
ncbi:MAG: integrase core domain-containing protein [Candidatus Competibacteraceae bacterium]|nr:integrase core domain-containing protein [Candidatus Competibacteraceae bacterium]